MGDLALKLKMLWLYGPRHIGEWYRDVWKREAGERMCCNGYMCGCYGSDYASMWECLWKTRNAKPTPIPRHGGGE